MMNVDLFLFLFHVIFLICTGIYYIVATTLLDPVVVLGRGTVEIRELTNR